MTPEAQRIAIAEACGWLFHNNQAQWIHGGPSPRCSGYADFPNDLNAMHEAEDTCLDSTNEFDYQAMLKIITNQPYGYRATAAQRAEAFLRAIGKWE